MITVLGIAQFFKGEEMMTAFKELGCHTVLVATARLQDRPWPRDVIDEVFYLPDFDNEETLLHGISYLGQDRAFDVVVPLDEYCVEVAARLRAHLGRPGLCEGVARKVRDKLTMRLLAQEHGIPVPDFGGFNNREELARFLEQTPPPWMLKPRAAGGSVQIRKLHDPQRVWELYERFGDQRSHHLIEGFLPGEVYHVDSVVYDGKVELAVVGNYGRPPFLVWHGGGVFTSRTVPKGSKLHRNLLKTNKAVLEAVGIDRGVNHVEFLGLGDDVYFLEIGARVPGSHLDRLTTAATGVDLFKEAARLELSWLPGFDYSVPKFSQREAGMVQCLARQKQPCLKFAQCPELDWHLAWDHHLSLAFASDSSATIDGLMEQFGRHLQEEILAVLPASTSPAQ